MTITVDAGAPAAVKRLADDIDGALAGQRRARIVKLAAYEAADLPDAARHAGSLIYVSDAAGGAVPAFSDGAQWRSCADRNVIS